MKRNFDIRTDFDLADIMADADYVLPEIFEPLCDPDITWKRAYLLGARGASKTGFVIPFTILYIRSDWRHEEYTARDVLFARYFQKNVDETMKPQMERTIRAMGLSVHPEPNAEWKFTRKEILHIPTGITTKFVGLKDAETTANLKGFDNIGLTVIDEANVVPEAAINEFLPSVLREKGSRAIMVSNIVREGEWILDHADHFEEIQDPRVYVFRTTFEDNPFIDDDFLLEIAQEELRDYEFWLHKYMGKPYPAGKFAVWEKYKHYEFNDMEDYVKEHDLTPIYAIDFGQGERSAAVIGRIYCIDDPKISDRTTYYISETSHVIGMADRHLPALICGDPRPGFDHWRNPHSLPGLIHPSEKDKHFIYVDKDLNAIKELEAHGFNVVPAPKPPNCVVKRIDHMKLHKLIIRESHCQLLVDELPMQKYQKLANTTDTPDPTKPPVKGYDNATDMIGYGVTGCGWYVIDDDTDMSADMFGLDALLRRHGHG